MKELGINVHDNVISENGKLIVANELTMIKQYQSFDNYTKQLSLTSEKLNHNIVNESHYYRYDYVPQVGRSDETETLEKFCFFDEREVLWMAVTGKAGIGKSRLVFEFAKKHLNKDDWDFLYLDWKKYRLQDCFQKEEYLFLSNKCIIIDYFTAYAQEIGLWIANIIKNGELNHNKFRLILIERENDSDDKKAIWRTQLITSDIGVEDVWYGRNIALSGLNEYEAFTIAQYIWKKKEKNGLEYNKFVSQIYKPLMIICDEELSLNLLQMYVEALVSDDSILDLNDYRGLLDWWRGQEKKRVESICKYDSRIIKDISYIMFLANIFGGIDILELKAINEQI